MRSDNKENQEVAAKQTQKLTGVLHKRNTLTPCFVLRKSSPFFPIAGQ